MNTYTALLKELPQKSRTWLVTGAAGFIGSHLAEALLRLGQKVRGLDNFSSGHKENLEAVKKGAGPEAWANFTFMKGDIRNARTCARACAGADMVLHHAALGSVPRSIEDPAAAHADNAGGFLNMLIAARDAGARGLVYASSSAVYGDNQDMPKREDNIGAPLSPYAATKFINELYARVFALNYGFKSIGLRYFNVFGERQDPNGPYAAVIPQWFAAALRGEDIRINGDGKTTRDFCFIENCVQANLLAAENADPEAWNRVYNIAVGQSVDLNHLCGLIRNKAAEFSPLAGKSAVIHQDFRPGDARYSLADISLAQRLLGYEPAYDLERGLERCSSWYAELFSPARGPRPDMPGHAP